MLRLWFLWLVHICICVRWCGKVFSFAHRPKFFMHMLCKLVISLTVCRYTYKMTIFLWFVRASTKISPGHVSLYWGVFNILKITTTTHNDIVCISFNSKSAHIDPPIYIYMQKENSLSFQMVLGSGGRWLSLMRWRKMVEIVNFMEF
jgi:hypothetical protein